MNQTYENFVNHKIMMGIIGGVLALVALFAIFLAISKSNLSPSTKLACCGAASLLVGTQLMDTSASPVFTGISAALVGATVSSLMSNTLAVK